MLLAAAVGLIVFGPRRRESPELAALRERERQLRTLFGNLPGIAYRCRVGNGNPFDFASDGVEELLGHSAEELGPKGSVRFLDLVHPDDRTRVVAVVSAALVRRERFTVTFRVRRRDGTERWVWDRGIGVYDTRGEAAAIEGFATDVTEQHRLEEERVRLLEEAQRAVSSREGFLAMAMHDIRSPLTALKLHVQASLRRLGQESPPSLREMERMLRKVEGQVERMKVLLDDLLDVNRAASGRLEVRLQEMDLCTLVNEVLKRHRLQLETAGCAVRVQCDAPIIGRWDWLRLEQVLTNLLSNAAKYGGSQPIDINLEPVGSNARMEVRDHGAGLTPEECNRLFQRYERLSQDHRVGSTGLGLWIVKTIVQALGGSVEAHSNGPGEGTSFVVLLPLNGPPPAPAPEVTPGPTEPLELTPDPALAPAAAPPNTLRPT